MAETIFPEKFPEIGQTVMIVTTNPKPHNWPDKIVGIVCDRRILRHHYRLDVDSLQENGHILLLRKGKVYGWFLDGLMQ